jgi:uncharacterized protein YndB with AHSA1/START domain
MNEELGEIKASYGVWFRRRSKFPPSRVWRAISNADEVSRWMTYPARIDLRPGGEYFVDFSRTDEGALDGIISHLEPGRRLPFVWGTSTVEWVLEPDGTGTKYLFAHHGQYPRPIADEEGLAAGWHSWLDDLDYVIEHGTASPDAQRHDRWLALKPSYRSSIESVISLDVPARS